MKVEWNGVRDGGAGAFGQRLPVENQQPRVSRLRVEAHSEHDAVVLRVAIGPRNEHRLAEIGAVAVELLCGSRSDVDFYDGTRPAGRRLLDTLGVHVPVFATPDGGRNPGKSGAARVVFGPVTTPPVQGSCWT